jgi:hypothetical protein
LSDDGGGVGSQRDRETSNDINRVGRCVYEYIVYHIQVCEYSWPRVLSQGVNVYVQYGVCMECGVSDSRGSELLNRNGYRMVNLFPTEIGVTKSITELG